MQILGVEILSKLKCVCGQVYKCFCFLNYKVLINTEYQWFM